MVTVSTDDIPTEVPALDKRGLSPARLRQLAEADAAFVRSLFLHLKGLRLEQGLSQRAVADRMGVTQSAVSDIERLVAGTTYLSTLQNYARAVGVRVRLGLELTDARPPPVDAGQLDLFATAEGVDVGTD